MPLPPDSPQRLLKHRRGLDIEIYSRPDGDRFHALRSDGEAVRLHCPKWHRQPGAKKAADNRPVPSGPLSTSSPRSPESPGP